MARVIDDPNVCATCTGACCRDVVVGITGADAWRIATARSLAFDDFLSVATSEAGDAGAFRLSGGFASLVLARHPDDERACAFLAEAIDGVRLCATHASRPRVCRIYPMQVRGREVRVRSNVVCKPTDWDAAAIDASRWRREFDRYTDEWQVYECVVDVWNATGLDDLATFYDVLRRAYDALAARVRRPSHSAGSEP